MFKQKSDPAAAPLSPADAVQQARTRARRRLIGAIVLLAIGIIGFPLVFETQPRPIPVDIPIEIPRKDAVPPLVAPPTPAATPGASAGASNDEIITEPRGDVGREAVPPRAPAPAASGIAPTSAAAAEASRHAATAAATSAASRPAETPHADAERARALLEGRPVAANESLRFVVQIGAFADAQAARETRQKAEKLGLKTYTQVTQTPAGNRTRVRVGPFASRDEAEAALAKAKAAGLSAVVLTL